MQDRGSGPALRSRVAGGRLWVVAAIAAVTVAVDQATKAWAVEALDDGRTIDLIWTLRFRLVLNRGSAFGIVEGFAPLFALAALVIVIYLLRAGRSVRGRIALTAVGLVIGGALGNLADRLFREGGGLFGGAVVDFVDLQWWPVFNVADAAIVVGSVLLALTAAREEP